MLTYLLISGFFLFIPGQLLTSKHHYSSYPLVDRFVVDLYHAPESLYTNQVVFFTFYFHGLAATKPDPKLPRHLFVGNGRQTVVSFF